MRLDGVQTTDTLNHIEAVRIRAVCLLLTRLLACPAEIMSQHTAVEGGAERAPICSAAPLRPRAAFVMRATSPIVGAEIGIVTAWRDD